MSEVCGASTAESHPRPAAVCARLLFALESADGRRRSRKRDQTPDAVGINAKRALLEAVVRDDPSPGAFDAWLLAYVDAMDAGSTRSAAAAMARAVFDEWQLAQSMPSFADWLELGAPSDDAGERPGAGR